MVKITKSALSRLSGILRQHGGELCLRLALESPGRLGLMLDAEAEGDVAVFDGRHKVLLINRDIAPLLEGVTIESGTLGSQPALLLTGEAAVPAPAARTEVRRLDYEDSRHIAA
ncbi:MAG: hypothetical protein HYX96_02940 [Chloroflexi bacterium]|nr:hypothetical protein [Chloroflexota bacterium]